MIRVPNRSNLIRQAWLGTCWELPRIPADDADGCGLLSKHSRVFARSCGFFLFQLFQARLAESVWNSLECKRARTRENARIKKQKWRRVSSCRSVHIGQLRGRQYCGRPGARQSRRAGKPSRRSEWRSGTTPAAATASARRDAMTPESRSHPGAGSRSRDESRSTRAARHRAESRRARCACPSRRR